MFSGTNEIVTADTQDVVKSLEVVRLRLSKLEHGF
jgi:hypothetical protein